MFLNIEEQKSYLNKVRSEVIRAEAETCFPHEHENANKLSNVTLVSADYQFSAHKGRNHPNHNEMVLI